ncbi:deSI-like protein At4g17486 isoform X2 [Macadamia integrifolia]|uniref:deSI-like protein At4g17486 isoform X2 n=1 Tax=Macadamia integrifolia TaxID=60698 RepID=UPI001C4F6401|nr:deSI-like protein At4g17486 isoform X2 [Macadamia integrifolia]
MKVLGGLMGFEECRGRRDHQMGMTNTNGPNATSSGSSEGNYETQVYLNVYDLTPINNYMYWFGLGIFHSGIEVYGVEYGFGAHDFPASGVFEVEPQSCPGFVYRCSILLGRLNMPASEFRKFIENVSSEYHGDTYHLISKNCNHFTADISYRLTGKRIPGWVNRLARVVVCFLKSFKNPLLNNCLMTTCSQKKIFQSLSQPTHMRLRKAMMQIKISIFFQHRMVLQDCLLSKRSKGEPNLS